MGGKSPNPVRKVNHFFFGQVVRKKSFNKDVITASFPVINKQQFDQWQYFYNIVQSMNKDSIFIPQGYQYRKIQNSALDCKRCCGAQYEAQMTYQQFDFNLSAQIQNRKSIKKQYSQPELLYLLYRLLQGGKQFQKAGIHIGDVRTQNLLVTREREVKMINLASFPRQHTAIQKVIDNMDKNTVFFFAPQQLEYVKMRGTVNQKFPNPKTQAWSIGLCVLQAATLQSSQTLYDKRQRKINQAQLKQRLKIVQRKYPLLFQFLRKILTIDISQRMTSGQAWACMRPYSQKITQFESFTRNQVAEQAQMKKFISDKAVQKGLQKSVKAKT